MPFRLCPFDCKPVDRSDGGTAAHQQCKVKGRTRCAAAALAACCMAACCVLLTLHNDNGPNTRHFNIGNAHPPTPSTRGQASHWLSLNNHTFVSTSSS